MAAVNSIKSASGNAVALATYARLNAANAIALATDGLVHDAAYFAAKTTARNAAIMADAIAAKASFMAGKPHFLSCRL